MNQHKTIEVNPSYIDIDTLIAGLPVSSSLKYHSMKFAMDKTSARVKFDRQKVTEDYFATVTVPLRARVNLPVITEDFKERLKGIKRIKENLADAERFFKSVTELSTGSTAGGIIEAGQTFPKVRLSHITFESDRGVLFKFKHRSEAGKRSALILEDVTDINGVKRNVTLLTDDELKACVKILADIYHTECEWTVGRNGFSCGAGAKVTKELDGIDA